MIDKTRRPFFRDRKPDATAKATTRATTKGQPRSGSAPAEARTAKSRPVKPRTVKPGFAKKEGSGPAATHAGTPGGKRPLRRPQKPASPIAAAPHEDAAGMRIAKVMARAGLCSRRDAEVWISEGRVTLNGEVLTSPAMNVRSQDEVCVDGQALAPRERTRLFLFHKPRGLVTTDKDPEGRETIFDYLRQHWPDGPRVISIGRLDINTEGLLLLTNDGGLARVLELPTTGWTRRYRVRANGKTDQAVLDRLRAGVTVDGVDYAGIEASLDRVQGDNVWLSLSLREGKNREIKRVLENIGLYVNRLIRVSFGPFQLGELVEGAVEEVRTRVLREQLGPVLEEEADADFESPIADQQPVAIAEPRGRGARTANAERPREREPRGARERERPERPETRKVSPSRAGKLARDARSGSRERPEPLERGDFGAKRSTDMKRDRPQGLERKAGRKPESASPSSPLEPSFKPRGPRKHISAMRAVEASAKGERKKAFQSETADRKGRAVVVERIAPAVQRRDPRQEDRQEDRRERTASPRAKRNEPATSGRRTERDERAGSKASFAGKGRKPGKPQAGLTDKAPVSRGPAKRPDGTDARNPASQRTSWTQRPVRGEKAGGIERPPRGGKPSRGDGPNKGGRPAAAKPNRPPRKH